MKFLDRCLFLCRVHVFRISVNVMPFLFFFFITFCIRCGMVRDTACRSTDDPFSAFLSPGAQEAVQHQNNICLVQAAERKNILGIDPKQIIIPAPFHSKAFAILYKSETSWELLGRLSRSFLSAISGASNFKHSLLMTLSGLANYVRVSSSSLLFCIQPSLKLFQLLFSGLLVFPFLSGCKNFHFSMIILHPCKFSDFPVFYKFLQQTSQ